ncbi:hypothetical protein Q31a_08400 [Aureliella helgolandensis]|uniref:Uncharacterized protein n=1 Tax=Aureliella helgolandensis TaxID=2527968 RepID=A0A518G1U1_9BACT|nr:hypothetical protein Q31a_08400 [Aureliella helgolandensis]
MTVRLGAGATLPHMFRILTQSSTGQCNLIEADKLQTCFRKEWEGIFDALSRDLGRHHKSQIPS